THEILQHLADSGRATVLFREHAIGHRLFQGVGIAPSHNPRFLYSRVFDERVLDLHRADPDPAHFQHVIGAAGIPVEAVGVAIELVAGADPLALDRVLGAFVLVPVVGAGAVALDQEVAHGAIGDVDARIVDDPCFVARDQLAGRAGTSTGWTIGNKDMENLGAADAIQDLDAEALAETIVEGFGQRLPGGDGEANTREIKVGALATMREQLAVVRRDREEQARLEALDLRVDVGRRWRARPENRRRADGKWKGERV